MFRSSVWPKAARLLQKPSQIASFFLLLVTKMVFEVCSSLINIVHTKFLIEGDNSSLKYLIASNSVGHRADNVKIIYC